MNPTSPSLRRDVPRETETNKAETETIMFGGDIRLHGVRKTPAHIIKSYVSEPKNGTVTLCGLTRSFDDTIQNGDAIRDMKFPRKFCRKCMKALRANEQDS